MARLPNPPGDIAMMDEGEVEKWKSDGASQSKKLAPNDHVAYMGELVIARSSGTLEANGGPCPIIAIYRPDVHLGAILHVFGGDAEIEGDNDRVLIDRLLEMEDEIADGAICHIMLDQLPYPGMYDEKNEKEQKKTRRKYARGIKTYLEEQGFKKIKIVYDGVGKGVTLNTEEGALNVIDGAGDPVFKCAY